MMKPSLLARPWLTLLTAGTLLSLPALADQSDSHWIASWTASPQRVWDAGFVLPKNVPDALNNQTVRQQVRISLGGPRLRLVFSNAYGTQPVEIGAASVALGQGQVHVLRFGGQDHASIAPGAPLISDPVDLPAPALARLVVNIYLPQPTPLTSFHWDGRQTAWIMPGQQTASARTMADNAPGVQTTSARILLNAILVEAPRQARTVAVIGDSITDGAGASLNTDTRWPDALAQRLAPTVWR